MLPFLCGNPVSLIYLVFRLVGPLMARRFMPEGVMVQLMCGMYAKWVDLALATLQDF